MSQKRLSKQQVLHIAQLCDLTLSEEEIEKLSHMLTDAIDYVEILEELDTEKVEETYQVTGLHNVFQEPAEKQTTLSQQEALSNAKEVIKDMFATKAVFER